MENRQDPTDAYLFYVSVHSNGMQCNIHALDCVSGGACEHNILHIKTSTNTHKHSDTLEKFNSVLKYDSLVLDKLNVHNEIK